MDRQAFRQFLVERNVPEAKIEEFITLGERFEDFQTGSHQPAQRDVEAFSAILIREGSNTWDNYLALARYGQLTANDEVYITAIGMLDGSEAMDNLYDRLGRLAGEHKRDQVFEGIDLPPLGITAREKAQITAVLMDRLERLVDPQICVQILSPSLRDLPDEHYQADREIYLQCANLDEYLEKRGQEFIAMLETLKEEGRLFFTQEVTGEVIDYVRQHPEISQGVREGDRLIEVKIPYMTKQYLAETDEQLKRYAYCHCPWVRESILDGDVRVSSRFCACSAGFVKKPWEVIFGQPLQAEVVESVLQGDLWCKIAIHLPDGVV